MLNPDFRDMLSALFDAGAEFLIVGAYAMAAHGLPRATGDMDIWVRSDAANARRVLDALRAFGAPVASLSEADLTSPDIVFQIGVAPRRVDILTSIDGVEFEQAWRGRTEADLGGVRLPILGKDDLIANKRAAGRPKDLVDLAALEETGC